MYNDSRCGPHSGPINYGRDLETSKATAAVSAGEYPLVRVDDYVVVPFTSLKIEDKKMILPDGSKDALKALPEFNTPVNSPTTKRDAAPVKAGAAALLSSLALHVVGRGVPASPQRGMERRTKPEARISRRSPD